MAVATRAAEPERRIAARARRRNPFRTLALLAMVGGALLALSILAAMLTENSYWARTVAWRESTAADFPTKFTSRGAERTTRV
jgi:hypothetical protein